MLSWSQRNKKKRASGGKDEKQSLGDVFQNENNDTAMNIMIFFLEKVFHSFLNALLYMVISGGNLILLFQQGSKEGRKGPQMENVAKLTDMNWWEIGCGFPLTATFHQLGFMQSTEWAFK